MTHDSASRRRFLTLWLGAGALLARPAEARTPLFPTPECNSGPTPRQTEGPFYLPRTPARADLTGDGEGDTVALFGRVLTRGCQPLAGAIVDLWHADGKGGYDERGYRFRAHQATDSEGRFAFRTIRPGRYPGRTPHYHVILARGGKRLLTTQLYFPGEPGNARDGIFDRRLLMRVADAGREQAARFDFVVAG
jgi:protocatechuate 3,4-dioxygenase beta subunit